MRKTNVTNQRIQILTSINGQSAMIDVFTIIPKEIDENKFIHSILLLLFVDY